MRVLFTTVPAYGHLTPMVPLARAVRAAGHTVAVATAESFGPVVERAGFDLVPAGIDETTAQRRLVERHPAFPTLPRAERSRRIVTELFARTYAPAFVADADRLRDWRPDVIVREEGEFASPLIATLTGVPWVDHGWGPLRPPDQLAEAASAIAPLWREHDVEPPAMAGAYRWLYLDPCPPSLQLAVAHAIDVRHAVSPLQPATPRDDVPDWIADLGRRRVVYVTLGTVPAVTADIEFFEIVLAALDRQDVEVVVTVGPEGDPARLGARSPSVHVERFVPQDAVLRHASVAVTNGGAGSTLGALTAGVPILAVPGTPPSQARNADAIVRAGAGRFVERDAFTVDRALREIHTLLEDPRYRRAASRVADEIAAMPPPASAVALIERLVVGREPVRSVGH